MTIPKPYNHPLLPTLHAKDEGMAPPPIRHVALASKSYRAYGLRNVDAWKVAFEARKRVERAQRRGRSNNGGGETAAEELAGGEEEEEEDEELEELRHIQQAIETALSDDAGGFGTAGFHKVGFRSWLAGWLAGVLLSAGYTLFFEGYYLLQQPATCHFLNVK